jgi:hypothetical protein
MPKKTKKTKTKTKPRKSSKSKGAPLKKAASVAIDDLRKIFRVKIK